MHQSGDTIYETAAETAKRVRAILKVKFPGVKFSVRSSTYSGGSSVHVGWTDGPLTDQVNLAIKWLEGADFDGMQDLKTYNPPLVSQPDGSLVKIHGADFIFTEREITEAKRQDMDRLVREHFTPECADKILNGPDRWYWVNKLERIAAGLEKE